MTRFAPSPTGLLHLGHAASALVAWERARAGGGQFLLRMEDIDPGRCRPEFAAGIEDDLRWLGLAWDGPVRVQSRHLHEYAVVLGRLQQAGLLYPCFCSRAGIAREVAAAGHAPHLVPTGPDGAAVYPGTCRGIPAGEGAERVAAGEAHALRLDNGEALRRAGPLSWFEEGEGRVACDAAAFGDVVLGRRDAPASYHLCVTHDDAVQGVTLVTRGEDLRAATSVHRLLQALMEWPEPRYAHHALLLGVDGRRLAKRDGAVGLRELRAAGVTAAEVLRQVRAGMTAPAGSTASRPAWDRDCPGSG